MIVSASYRTDIPAFHADWFARRLAEGWCAVRNPYGGKPYRVALAGPEVDGFVFWTRNTAPFMGVLDRLDAPFVVQATVTGYPRALDRRTPAPADAIAGLRAIRDRWGAHAVVWRYDPILIGEATPADWHIDNFRALAGAMAGLTDEVTVSFTQLYAKSRRNLDGAIGAGAYRDPDPGEKIALIDRLAGLAGEVGMRLTLCTQPDLVDGARMPASCIDAARLSAVADRPIVARTKGNRPGCLCAESRDIGAYDTCGHGCVYCYAVANHAKARTRAKAQPVGAERLG